jgi:hypothetical protein
MRNMLRATPVLLCASMFAGSAWAGPYTPGLAAALDSYLTSVASPLAGLGTQLFNDGVLYNLDPRLVVAIAGAESNYGITPTTCGFDAWVWLPPATCGAGFASYSAGVDSVSLGLRQNYLDYGYTSIPLIGATYCSGACSAAWISSVTSAYTALGGDPTDLTFTAPGSLITFEDLGPSSPSIFANYTAPESVSYSIDTATTVSFNGGVTLSSTTNLPGDQSTVYGTAYSTSGGYCNIPTVCASTGQITIGFTAPVMNFSVYMINGNTATITYTVMDQLGNSSQVTLVPNFSSGLSTVALPPTDAVTQVTISPGAAPAGACCVWDYFIDNVSFAPTQ